MKQRDRLRDPRAQEPCLQTFKPLGHSVPLLGLWSSASDLALAVSLTAVRPSESLSFSEPELWTCEPGSFPGTCEGQGWM